MSDAFLKSAFLGLLQGLTEFLPLSSSGHLVLAGELWRLPEENFLFDALLHLSTFLAVLFYFRRDLKLLFFSRLKEKALGRNLVLATLPALLAAGLFLPFLQTFFEQALVVALLMILTGVLLFLFERFSLPAKKSFTNFQPALSLTVGLAQALALLPGISRSGLTIGSAIFSGAKRQEAVRFSFLLSLPLIFLAGVYALFQASVERALVFDLAFLLGFGTAFLAALLAISFMMRYLNRRSLLPFAFYLWLLGGGFIIGRFFF